MTQRPELGATAGTAFPLEQDDAMHSVRALDVATASDAELRALQEHMSRLQCDRLPDDPPLSLEAGVHRIRSWDAMETTAIRIHTIWKRERIVAHVRSHIPLRDDNRHLMHVVIEVDRDHRRQGLARDLLRRVLADAHEYDRSLILGNTHARVPEGEAFAVAVGATCGLTVHTHQLALADVDRALLKTWASNHALPAEYKLELWKGAIPDEHLEAYCAVATAINGAPRGNLVVEDMTLTPKDIRQLEAHYALLGVRAWTLVVWHRPSSSLVGFTEVAWDPAEPHVIKQGTTVVLPDHRGKDLGRRLKQRMLSEIFANPQEARFIRTENADANAGMLTINRGLGFRPYSAEAYWQVSCAAVEDYVERETKNLSNTLEFPSSRR